MSATMPPRVFDTQVVNWVKMYADLTGNCKKQRIKSHCDNRVNQDYIRGYQNEGTVTHYVFVDPMHIGAIVNGHDGAMRVKQYFVYASFAGTNKGIYHSSKYGELTDEEYRTMLQEAIQATGELKDEAEVKLGEKKALI